MNITGIKAFNFGSFEGLGLDLTTLSGPIVIEGDTGAGKSTLLDVIAWALYGETSKATKSDEVISWGSENATEATVYFTVAVVEYVITRTRGKRNDLVLEKDGAVIRGVNLKDTQAIINKTIGLDYQAFTACAYFTQFSESEQFFISKPSDRRETLERLVDTEIAVRLGTRCLEKKKKTKQELLTEEMTIHGLVSGLETLDTSISRRKKESELFEIEKARNLASVVGKMLFTKDVKELEVKEAETDLHVQVMTNDRRILEQEQAELNHILAMSDIKHTCPSCEFVFSDNPLSDRKDTQSRLQEINIELVTISDYILKERAALQTLRQEIKMHYKEGSPSALNQLFDMYTKSKNIHEEQISKMEKEKQEKLTQLSTNREKKKKRLAEIARLDVLYDLSIKLRSQLLTNSIVNIQTEVNRLLVRHFDAEVKLSLFMLDGDSLDVKIERNGNECSFKALSGGQRCILKLCLWLAMKKAIENKHQVSVNLVMLDESLHGLSDRLKQQAYGLIEEIAAIHSPVLVVDHNEGLKSCFSQKLTVYQYEGHSKLSYA